MERRGCQAGYFCQRSEGFAGADGRRGLDGLKTAKESGELVGERRLEGKGLAGERLGEFEPGGMEEVAAKADAFGLGL